MTPSLLIVYPGAFHDAAVRLVQHKRDTGMPAYGYDLRHLIDGQPGRDDAEKLKHAIYDAHRDDRHVRFVLLLGDARRIPVRYRNTPQIVGFNGNPFSDWYSAADLYYANLYQKHTAHGEKATADSTSGFNTWDANNDGCYDTHHWGKDDITTWNPDKVDGCPDVAVGRVPAHTAEEADIYVSKVIAYETGPGAAAAAAFIAEKEYDGSGSLADSVIRDGKLHANGFQTPRVGYGYAPGEALPPGTLHWTPEEASRAGAFLVYIGHGGTSSWGHGDSAVYDQLTRAQVDGFQSGSLPVVVSIGCSTGDFAPGAPDDARPSYVDQHGIVHSFSRTDQGFPFTVNDAPVDAAGNVLPPRTWTVRSIDDPKVPVPPPAEYDFERRCPSFGVSWLFNRSGGGIAFFGETSVGQDNWGADLATGMFAAWAGTGTVLGNLWLAGGQRYWTRYQDSEDSIGAARCYLTYMTLLGDPSLRIKIRPHDLPAPPAPHRVWGATWSAGWTTLEPMILGNAAHLFAYKSGDGTVAIDRFADGGQGTVGLWRDRWTPGFTTVAPLAVGGQAYVLAYNAGTGAAAVSRVNGPSGGLTEVWHATWTKGWTSLVPFTFAGQTYLLAYKAGDGTVAIDKVNDGGLGTTEVWRSTWSTGWTSIVLFPMGGRVHFFFYKASTGEMAFDQLADGAQGTTTLSRGSWTAGWTAIRSLGMVGRLIEYKAGDGTVAMDQLDGNGSGSRELWRSFWPARYSTIVPFTLPIREGLVDYALCHNAATGETAIIELDRLHLQT